MRRVRDAAEVEAENILARIAYLAGEAPTGKPGPAQIRPLSEREFKRRVAQLQRQARGFEARNKKAS